MCSMSQQVPVGECVYIYNLLVNEINPLTWTPVLIIIKKHLILDLKYSSLKTQNKEQIGYLFSHYNIWSKTNKNKIINEKEKVILIVSSMKIKSH